MRIRWVLSFFSFLFFVEDGQTMYGRVWFAPFGWATDFFYMKLPHRIRPMDHVLAICLFLALKTADAKGPRVMPMRNTLLLSAATLTLWFVYGFLRGGDLNMASFQVYALMSGVLFAFTIAATFRTPEHYAMLAKVVVFAGLYRAVMCWLFYFTYVRSMRIPIPEYVTSHDDSVLWVVSIFILLTRFFKKQTGGQLFATFLCFALIFGAIQFNTRRLAWVSLAMGLVTAYFLLPPGKVKRGGKRLVTVVLPILALYVAVGWGRTERMFKPLQAFASVSTTEDASTKSRNVENLGLLFTARTNGWLIGSGWGHKYLLVSNKYDLTPWFPLWRFIPHNSILGLFAFTGAFGYCGYWLTFPTAMFLNARLARNAKSLSVSQMGLLGGVQMVVAVNQYFGDMGMFQYKVIYVMATSYAIALRTPILAGVWPSPKTAASRKAMAGAAAGQASQAGQAHEGNVAAEGRQGRGDAWGS